MQPTIIMISFIVIGKNEGWRLEKCLNSIKVRATEELSQPYEIIYVDSKSSDDSINLSKLYADKTFLLTGECNAAIGRNVGASEAKGDILFFLDGDMELRTGVLSTIVDKNNKLTYPFMSGIEYDFLYDQEWNKVEEKPRRAFRENDPTFEKVTGGLFVTERTLWQKVGGMDNRFVRSQDYDFGLRLCNTGIKLKRLGTLWVNHYTRYYAVRTDSLTVFKYPALLSRKHFFEPNAFRTLFYWNYSAYMLILCIIATIISFNYWLLLPYLIVLLYRSAKVVQRTPTGLGFAHTLYKRFVKDLLFVYYFCTFYPKQPHVTYKAI